MRRDGTRLVLFAAIAAIAVFGAAPANAVEQGQIGLHAQGGIAHAAGDLSGVLDDSFAIGGGLAYGLIDWLAVELDGQYSRMYEVDDDDRGDLTVDLGGVSAGPRFTWHLKWAELWLAVGAGAILHRTEVEYEDASGDDRKDDRSGAAMSAAGGAGVDFRVSDSFRVGVLGRAAYGLTDLSMPSSAGTRTERPLLVFGLARGVLLF